MDLGIKSVVIARMDVSDENPPVEGLVSDLPTLVLMPAYDKVPPFQFYSGLAKVLPIMTWVQEHASIGFDLPDLPHPELQ